MDMKAKGKVLLTLFREMFFISAFVLGGGYVILSAADARFSRKLKLIREGELFEMLPLFQMIPGIIGGHTAVYLGARVAGVAGAAVALAATLLPSILIFLAVSVVYRSIPVDSFAMSSIFLGLRSALTGLLAEILVRTWRKSVTGVYGPLAFATATALVFTRLVPPGAVILAGLIVGTFIVHMKDHRSAETGKRVFRSISAIPLLFLGYGLIAFGGGFVLVPSYLNDFVGPTAPYLQLAPHDFANVMALSEMTPGPVAANCATFFGYGLGGVPGALLATLLLVLPGSTILLIALRSVEKFRTSVLVRGLFFGVRPVTMALIACATVSFARMSVFACAEGSFSISPTGAALALVAPAAALSRRIGAVAIIILSALAALAIEILTR